MTRLYVWLAGIVLLMSVGVGAYWSGYQHGDDVGATREQNKWKDEKLEMAEARDKAIKERDQALAGLFAKEKKDAEEREAENQRRAAADASAARELQRLRDALATARIGAREASTTTPGPQPDGRGEILNQLFGECAADLVALGKEAGRLAGKVTGLQSYAQTAQQACGPK